MPRTLCLTILTALLATGCEKDVQDYVESWVKRNAPKGYVKRDREESVRISEDFDGRKGDGRIVFYKFPGGDSIREDQPGLLVFDADLSNGKTQGGSGVTVFGTSRIRNWHFKGPSERLLKVSDGAKVYLDNCLFNGAPVHTILIGKGGKVFSGRNSPNIYLEAESAFRPMAIRHGRKGPDDDPKPIRKWSGTYTESSEDDVFDGIGTPWKKAHSNDRFVRK